MADILVTIAIWSIDLILLGVFAVLIFPYIKWMFYIKKKRKSVRRIKELKRLVAQHYGFD